MSSSKKHHNSRRQSSLKYRSQAKRALRKSVEQRRIGLDVLQAAQFQVLKLFARVQRLHDSIDEAFAGSPFLPGVAPNAPVNTQRFTACLARHTEVAKLFKRALDLWMLAGGMKLEDNWVPLLIENMRQTVAAKGTGATAERGK